MKKTKFKSIGRNKIKDAACKSQNAQKEKHSKMSGIAYKKLERAEYLGNPFFNSEGVKLLLALRTQTVTGIKNVS